MIRLRRPDGSYIYMGSGFIVEPAGREGASEAKTRVTYGGVIRYVLDEVESVVKMIDGGDDIRR